MAIYSLVPTQKMIYLARENNKNPYEYLNSKTYKIPAHAGYDKRRMDKYGVEYLEDVLITREDGSQFIIHELTSDIDDLNLYELKELDKNHKIIDRVLVYMDNLDYSKLQSEEDYLDCLGDALLSKNRIARKKDLSKGYELEEIYAGYVSRDSSTGEYVKTIRNNDTITLKYISAKKQEKEFNELETLKERKSKLEKEKMISAIYKSLPRFSNEELKTICETLQIPEENYALSDILSDKDYDLDNEER